MFRRMYNKYKPALLLSVLTISSAIFSRLQEFVYASVVRVVYEVHGDSQLHPEFDPDYCLPPPNYENLQIVEDPVFYWSENEANAVLDLQVFYSPIFSSLFAGIYSDKYGGKNAVLLGLVLSGSMSSMLFSTVLRDDYTFLAMLILCSIGESMTSAAIWSLVGKWAMPHERTMFVSILFVGRSLGVFVANSIIRIMISWRTACYICGFMNFSITFWWWLLFRCRYTPEPRLFAFIPCRELIMSSSTYISSTLIITSSLVESISAGYFMQYGIHKIFIYVPYRITWIIQLMLALSEITAHLLCGAFSDYMLSEGLISTSSLRRTFSGVLFLFLYCALIVARVAKCDVELVLACCVMLHFTSAVFESTLYTVILDITSAYSGVIFGVIIWISRLVQHKIGRIIISVTDYGYTLRGSNNAFLLIAMAATLFIIPFVVNGVTQPSWGDGVPRPPDRHREARQAARRAGDPGPSIGH